jgi:uncharacterized protein Yka (UPF0111/DUF47 family)
MTANAAARCCLPSRAAACGVPRKPVLDAPRARRHTTSPLSGGSPLATATHPAMLKFLKKILGRDEKFYELLEASATQAHTSAVLLLQLHGNLANPAVVSTRLKELTQSRRSSKRIGGEITEALCKTFVTPFEREDIEALENALYKIPKISEKIGERISVVPLRVSADLVGKQLEMLLSTTEIVIKMVTMLRKVSQVEMIQDEYELLQNIEGEADKFMLGELRKLYSGDADAKETLILADIYGHLERSIDLCRDAGKVVFQVALKYA